MTIIPRKFKNIVLLGMASTLVAFAASTAYGEFIISSAILEFTKDGPRHQDVEIISRSDKNDYIVSEIAEIMHPGEADESRRIISDPAASRLIVSPDKTVLAGGSRKIIRFILLKDPDSEEHIYRVAIKPIINRVGTTDRVGLKILVGYEVLVIIRPHIIDSHYTISRESSGLLITNTGSNDILFENGTQCLAPASCKKLPVARVYSHQKVRITLPYPTSIASYTVWDGKDNMDKQF